MYKCEHFIIQELVSPETYNVRGDKAWELLDVTMLMTLDRLRDRYGKMIINNWKWGGNRKWSGLRIPESPYYSTYSQHSFGNAADVIFGSVTAEAVRKEILENPDDHAFEFITSIELEVFWLHFDCRNVERVLTYYA